MKNDAVLERTNCEVMSLRLTMTAELALCARCSVNFAVSYPSYTIMQPNNARLLHPKVLFVQLVSSLRLPQAPSHEQNTSRSGAQ
jgi:hypothetical protein